MRFSSLDANDLARAQAALETAWRAVDLAGIAEDEDDLALRARHS